jgi:tetratricopeptide (TPR) repeat protein
MNPKDSKAYCYLANALSDLGRKEDAIKNYKRAL